MSGLLVSRSRPACPSWRGSQRSAFRRGIVPVRDIYLKIETISGYSPVEPDDHVSPPIQYRRGCLRNKGPEGGAIPPGGGAARGRTGWVYREEPGPQQLVPRARKR